MSEVFQPRTKEEEARRDAEFELALSGRTERVVPIPPLKVPVSLS